MILQEELLKFNCKRIFNPTDELMLHTPAITLPNPSGKRIFNPCDKNHGLY
jgi:hypothetical protein